MFGHSINQEKKNSVTIQTVISKWFSKKEKKDE